MHCINTEYFIYLNDQLQREKQRKGPKDHGRVKSKIVTKVGNSWITEVMSVMHGLHKSSKEYQKNQLRELIFFSALKCYGKSGNHLCGSPSSSCPTTLVTVFSRLNAGPGPEEENVSKRLRRLSVV